MALDHPPVDTLSAASSVDDDISPPAVQAAGDRVEVAILVYDLRGSGVVRNAIRIAGAALQAGLKAELWVINDDGPMARDVPAGLTVRRIRQSPPGKRRALDSFRSVPRLAAMLRAHRPAVLFSAGNHVHAFAVLGHRLAGARDIRLIGRVSNALAATVPAKRAGLIGAVLRLLAVRWERLQFRAFDRLVAVSHELGDDLARYGKVDRRIVTVIPNGVDARHVRAQAREPVDHLWFSEDAPPVIVAAGRLSRQKNFAQLIEAFALLRQRDRARLVILGNGSAKDRAALLRLAGEWGVARDLWLAGYQANPYRFMARARLFAMTSRWEGSSNVVLEALACGLPIVATECPTGVREVLSGYPAGRLVPVGDAPATARAMHDLLFQPKGQGHVEPVLERYGLAQSLAGYRAFLAGEVAALAAQKRAE